MNQLISRGCDYNRIDFIHTGLHKGYTIKFKDFKNACGNVGVSFLEFLLTRIKSGLSQKQFYECFVYAFYLKRTYVSVFLYKKLSDVYLARADNVIKNNNNVDLFLKLIK